MSNNNELCKCGKVGKISCPNDERCGGNNQLPAEEQEKINNEALEYAKDEHGYDLADKGYIEGATTWAIWKLKYDELKGQSGPVWVKSETKPEHNVGVLVFIPGEDNHITAGMWDVSEEWVLLDEYRTPEEEVTHWMPLPALPEGYSRNELPEEWVRELKQIAKEELGKPTESGAIDWKDAFEEVRKSHKLINEAYVEALNERNDWKAQYEELKEELREKTNTLRSLRYSLDNRDAECKALKGGADKMEAALRDIAAGKLLPQLIAAQALAWKGGKEDAKK